MALLFRSGDRIKGRQTLIALVLLLAAGFAVPVAGQLTPPSLGVLVDQVVALFPKVEGQVIEVQGKTLTLSLGRREGIQAGIELSLYREGRELRHPKTGELLGRTEQDLGRVSVAEVFEAYSTGTVSRGSDIRPGDKARISAGKIKLTLLPLLGGVKEILAEAAIHELVEGLDRTGRFQISMGDAVSVWLAQEGFTGDEAIQGKGLAAAGERFKVEYLLAIYFKRVQNRPYMEVRLFAFPGATSLLSTAQFVPSSIKPAVKGEFSASPQPRSAAPPKQRSLLARLLGGELAAGTYSSGESSIPLREVARFGFPVLAMDVAVSPKDKIPQMVMTDGERIYLYRIVDRALRPEWSYAAGSGGRVISVQLADLDNDGVLEVVANRYHPQQSIGLTSLILTTKGGKASVVVQDLSQILLAVDANGDGVKKTLWAQRFTPDGFFAKGQAERYSLRTGALVLEGRVRVPSNFRATGAVMSNIGGKGTRSLAFIDEHNRLRIAYETEESWRSSTPVGGGGYLKVEVVTQIERSGRSHFYSMEPMPLAVDLDGDGIEEVVVPQNEVPGTLAVVFRGPAGFLLQSVNSGFEGTITGLGAIPSEGAPVLIAAVVRFSGLFKTSGETQIIMTVSE